MLSVSGPQLSVFDVSTHSIKSTYLPHSYINASKWNHNGKAIGSVTSSGEVLLTSVDGQLHRTLAVPVKKERINSLTTLAFTKGSRYVAAGGSDAEIQVWDFKTVSNIRNFGGHSGPIKGLSFVNDSTLLSSSSSMVLLHDMVTSTITQRVPLEFDGNMFVKEERVYFGNSSTLSFLDLITCKVDTLPLASGLIVGFAQNSMITLDDKKVQLWDKTFSNKNYFETNYSLTCFDSIEYNLFLGTSSGIVLNMDIRKFSSVIQNYNIFSGSISSINCFGSLPPPKDESLKEKGNSLLLYQTSNITTQAKSIDPFQFKSNDLVNESTFLSPVKSHVSTARDNIFTKDSNIIAPVVVPVVSSNNFSKSVDLNISTVLSPIKEQDNLHNSIFSRSNIPSTKVASDVSLNSERKDINTSNFFPRNDVSSNTVLQLNNVTLKNDPKLSDIKDSASAITKPTSRDVKKDLVPKDSPKRLLSPTTRKSSFLEVNMPRKDSGIFDVSASKTPVIEINNTKENNSSIIDNDSLRSVIREELADFYESHGLRHLKNLQLDMLSQFQLQKREMEVLMEGYFSKITSLMEENRYLKEALQKKNSFF